MTPPKIAETSVPVHPLLAQRWSPRGLDATHALGQRSVQALLEAAWWAPLANNSQPWRFLVAHRGEGTFTRLLGVLAPGNRSWAHAASALVLVAAQTVDDTGRSRPWALFDADAARHEFGLDTGLAPLVLAVGRRDADAEPLTARERAPRSREPLEALMLAARENPTRRVA